MESVDKISNYELNKKGIILNIREISVFLLLFFLNLKFIFITIIQDRSMVVDMFVYLFLLISFDYTKLRNKYFTLFIILVVFTAINFSEYKLNVLMPLIIAHAVVAIRLKRYLWMNFIIMGITIVVMYIINGQGDNMTGYTYGMDRKTRMNFGFNHPNVVTLYYYGFMINALLLLHFSRFRKLTPVYLLLVLPFSYYFYTLTGSRSFLFAMAALYACYIYYYVRNTYDKSYRVNLTRYVIILLPLLLTGLMVYLSLNKDDFHTLNKLLSHRLFYYNKFLTGISPFEFFFGTDSYKEIIIDSSYIHLLFEGGIIFFIFFIYFYMLSMNRIAKDNQWLFIVIIVSFLVYGLMESLLVYCMLISNNIFWVLQNYYFRNKPINPDGSVRSSHNSP